MPRQKQHCKNHPDRLTARKCYHCRDPICTECEQTIDHHRFCGYWCYAKWKLQSIFGTIQFSKENIITFAFILLLNLIFFFYLNSRLNQLSDNDKPVVPAHIHHEVKSQYPAVHIDTTRLPLQNILQLKLDMAPGSVVAIRRDNKFVETKVQKNGSLKFDDLFLYSGKNSFAIFRLENGGQSQLIDSFSIDINSSRTNYLKQPVDRIRTKDKLVALTFDGGSLNNGTDRVLNILRECDIRCSIFLTGAFLEKYPDQVEEMINDGHEIGNHSYSHPHLTEYELNRSHSLLPAVNREYVYSQLLKTDSLYREISGSRMAPFWRAPFGEINKEILLWAAEIGFKHIGWSRYCDTHDWVSDSASALYRSGEDILDHLLTLEKDTGLNGKIILMHLSSDRKTDQPYLILKEMINDIEDRGYRFVTISQLLTQL